MFSSNTSIEGTVDDEIVVHGYLVHCILYSQPVHIYTVSRVRIYMIPTAAYDLSILIYVHQYTGRIFL